jgi:hypothetical protein
VHLDVVDPRVEVDQEVPESRHPHHPRLEAVVDTPISAMIAMQSA